MVVGGHRDQTGRNFISFSHQLSCFVTHAVVGGHHAAERTLICRNFIQLANKLSCFSHSTRLLAATTLRNVLGTRNLAEILSERESISKVWIGHLKDETDNNDKQKRVRCFTKTRFSVPQQMSLSSGQN